MLLFSNTTAKCIQQNPIEIGIVHQFPFNSQTQSMCVIGQVFGSRRYTAYCKGAPEKIIGHCLKESSNSKEKN